MKIYNSIIKTNTSKKLLRAKKSDLTFKERLDDITKNTTHKFHALSK